MAHIICLMRRIPRNIKERCGFIASKCMLGVRYVSCLVVSVLLLVAATMTHPGGSLLLVLLVVLLVLLLL